MIEPSERWTRWLHGVRSEIADAELACDLAVDRELAHTCAWDSVIDAQLRLLLAPQTEGDAFTQKFIERLRAERSGSRISVQRDRRRSQASVRGLARRRSQDAQVLVWPMAMAVGILALVAVTIVSIVDASSVAGEVITLNAPAQIIGRGGARSARAGDRVLVGERVVTFAGDTNGDAVISVRFNGGVRSDLAPGSDLQVTANGAVYLHRGRLYAVVDHPPGPVRERWHVRTDSADLIITGTRFDLSVLSTTVLRLEEGGVTIINAHGQQRVTALQECRVSPGSAPQSPRTINLAEIWRGQSRKILVAPEPTTPQSPISTGLRLWLDARYGIDQVDTRVSHWRDPRPGMLEAIQTEADERPALIPSGAGRGPAVRFDGRNTSLWLTGTDHFDSIRDSTIALRLRCPATGGRYNVAFGADSGSTKHAFEVGIRDGCFEIWGWSGAGRAPSYRIKTSTNDRHRWHHLVYRVKTNGGNFFVDGKVQSAVALVGEAAKPFSFVHAATASTRYRIGGTVDASGQLFAGEIASIMVFDRALSDGEIAILAEAP